VHNVNFPNVLRDHAPTNIPILSLGLKSPNNMMIFVEVSNHMKIVLDQDCNIVYKSPYKQVNHGVP
jgi:hypothetical protein